MRDSLVPFGSANGLSRLDRQVAREVAVVQAHASVQAARETAKINAITEITEEALLCASEVSQVAHMLASRSPFAGEELGFIAKAGITAMGDVVIRSGRTLR